MMEFDLKTGPQGHVYFPKKIRELLSEKMKLMPNSNAVVIFREGTSAAMIIASLELIIQDLKIKAMEA